MTVPSPTTLGELLGLSRDNLLSFLRDDLGTRLVHFGGAGRDLDSLLNWSELGRCLQYSDLRFPRLRLVKLGKPVPEGDYVIHRFGHDGTLLSRLLPGPIARELRQGATLVIDAIDELHDSIGTLAFGLEAELRERAEVNAYATWGHVAGSPVHWDDHEVFVVQVQGRKAWQIFQPTRIAPLAVDVEQAALPSGAPAAEMILEAGDVLYVPRGWWHSVTGVGEPSLHLTIGVRISTGIDLLTWLVEIMKKSEMARTNLPSSLVNPPERRAYLQTILDSVSSMFVGDDVIARFREYKDGQEPGRSHFGLGRVSEGGEVLICDSDLVLPQSPRSRVRIKDDEVELLIGGNIWTFSGVISPVLTAITNGKSQTVGSLLTLLQLEDRPLGKALLYDLMELGVVSIRAPEPE